MVMKDPNENFAENIRQTLNQSLDDLDQNTLSQLNQMKYRALDQTRKPSRRIVWGAVPATVVALLLVFMLNVQQSKTQQTMPTDISLLSLLTEADTLDFYAEDIEFYQWLSEVLNDEADPGNQRGHLSAPLESDLVFSRGNGRENGSEYRTARISWNIRG